jgi:hypothetical protein
MFCVLKTIYILYLIDITCFVHRGAASFFLRKVPRGEFFPYDRGSIEFDKAEMLWLDIRLKTFYKKPNIFWAKRDTI